MHTIQFETVVNGDIIQVPAQYKQSVHSGVKVRVFADISPKTDEKPKSKAGALSDDDFTALRIDTRGYKFDREEANERR